MAVVAVLDNYLPQISTVMPILRFCPSLVFHETTRDFIFFLVLFHDCIKILSSCGLKPHLAFVAHKFSVNMQGASIFLFAVAQPSASELFLCDPFF